MNDETTLVSVPKNVTFIPHDNRILVLKTDDSAKKLETGLYAVEQARMYQEGIVIAIGTGAGRDYAEHTFKVMDKVMYFNPIEVMLNGKVYHLVDCSNVLGWFERKGTNGDTNQDPSPQGN